MNIAYSSIIKRKPLPQDDSELCTKMNIVLIGDFKIDGTGDGDGLPMAFIDFGGTNEEPHDYLPSPITIEAEHPDHANYKHERVTAIDPRLDVFMRPADAAAYCTYNFDAADWNVNTGTTESALSDESKTDYLEVDAINGYYKTGNFYNFSGETRRIVGVKLIYKVKLKAAYDKDRPPLYVAIAHFSDGSDIDASAMGVSAFTEFFESNVTVNLPATDEERTYTKWVYFPWHAIQSEEFCTQVSSIVTIGINTDNLDAVSDFQLYSYYPLVVDKARLQDYAESFIKLPTPIPQSVEVAGYVQGDGRTATITSYPGGDQTLEVRQITRYPSRGTTGTTVIDLGALSDEVRKQKFFKEKQKDNTQASINRAAGGSRVKY